MALIACKNCDFEAAIGCMPTTTCGVLVTVGMSSGVLLGWEIGGFIWERYGMIWEISAGAAGMVAGTFILVWAVHFIPWTVEYLLAHLQKCPECGSRRWRFPFTRGFGL